MRKTVAGIVTVILVALVPTACGDEDTESASSDSDASGESFTVAAQPWIGYGPLTAVAPNQGFDEEEGVKIEVVSFNSDKESNAALAGGKLDAVFASGNEALAFASESGVPLKIVLLADISTEADAIIGRGISSVGDLAGKKVAVDEGAAGDLMLRYALDQEGLSADDIEVVPLPGSEGGTALLAGRVDAAVTYEPFITQAIAEDPNVEVIYTPGEREGLISDVLVVPDEVIEDKPEQVQGVVDAWGKSVDFYNSNPTQAQAMIAAEVEAPTKELKTAFEGVTFFDLTQNAEQLSGPFPDLLSEIQTIMIDAGLLENALDTADVVDPQFVEAAAQG